jgi:hypothetical protein
LSALPFFLESSHESVVLGRQLEFQILLKGSQYIILLQGASTHTSLKGLQKFGKTSEAGTEIRRKRGWFYLVEIDESQRPEA